jgi:hypothetical protein
MIRLPHFLAACLMAVSCLAQDLESPRAGVSTLHKLHFINPAYEFEGRLSNRLTVSLNGGVGLFLSAQASASSYGGLDTRFVVALVPVGHGTFRYYYDLERRAQRGRPTAGNSGSFFTAGALWSGNPLFGQAAEQYFGGASAMAGWGLQRTFHNNMNFEFVFGLAGGPIIGDTRIDWPAWPVVQFSFGYVFVRD